MSPFEALYGYQSPKLATYISRTTFNDTADKMLRTWEHIKQILKENLNFEQQQMKKY